MRYFSLCLLLCLLFVQNGQAQQGKVIESLEMQSSILGKTVRYSLYLPPDYDYASRSYPVVYLLHGYTDDETGWIQFGEVNRLADAGINSGELPPMIIVMPDGGVSWYMNDSEGKVRWEDMFVQEFMPHIEQSYRIRRKKEFRGIAGLSMGGFGSLLLSMHHPDLFGSCAALSSGVWTSEQMMSMPQDRYDRIYGLLYGKGLEGEQRINQHWYENSIISLVRKTDAESLKQVRYYIDCGDDDFLAIGNSTLHIELLKKEVPHEYRVRDGGHSWSYWRHTLPIGLKFIGESFHR